MKYLVDTNLLVRISNNQDPQHLTAMAAIEHLHAANATVFLVPQVVYEFWVVATRPLSGNGLGESPAKVDAILRKWCSLFTLRKNETGVYARWRDLVRKYSISGKTAHDARLVAAMLRHKIDRLLTFNESDFKRFSEITVVKPQSLGTP